MPGSPSGSKSGSGSFQNDGESGAPRSPCDHTKRFFSIYEVIENHQKFAMNCWPKVHLWSKGLALVTILYFIQVLAKKKKKADSLLFFWHPTAKFISACVFTATSHWVKKCSSLRRVGSLSLKMLFKPLFPFFRTVSWNKRALCFLQHLFIR